MSRRGRMPIWPLNAAAAIAVVGVLLAVFWPNAPTSLRVDDPFHNSAGSGIGHVPTGKPYLYATYRLCAAHGPVTVTAVRMREAHGLSIVDWGAAPDDGIIRETDSAPGTATMIGATKHRKITGRCTTDPHHPLGQTFAISVRRTAEIGVTNGFEVDSTSGSAVIPFRVELCASTCPGDDS